MLPKFLQFPIYALDISDESYKYLRFTNKGSGFVVSNFGEGQMPPGAIENGDIKKQDILTSHLKEVFLKNSVQYVALSLPEEKSFFRALRLSGVKREEISEALTLQLEEHIPLPPEEVVFTYEVAGKEKESASAKGGSEHFDIVLNAFPRSVVESYAEVVSGAGALPVLMESELHALLRSIVPKDFHKPAMIIDWGKTRTSFAIIDNGIVHFASTVSVGGKSLNEAISKSLNLDLKQSENMKWKQGFVKTGNKEDTEVFNAMVPVVSAIKDEAEKYINYYEAHSEKKSVVSHVFLSGGDANLLGLTDYLAGALGAEVILANPWVNMPFPQFYLPDIERKDSVRFSPAIGLALRAIRDANWYSSKNTNL